MPLLMTYGMSQNILVRPNLTKFINLTVMFFFIAKLHDYLTIIFCYFQVTGEHCALKLCDSRFTQQLQREVEAMRQLQHPNITKFYQLEYDVCVQYCTYSAWDIK